MRINTLAAGAAAEAYVHYRLRSWQIDAHFAGGINAPFDLWAHSDNHILKVQIKSTTVTTPSGSYHFTTTKGHNGLYHPEDWDILGLVALPEERVWFTLRGDSKSRTLPPESFTEEEERKSWERVSRLLQGKREQEK